MADFCEFQQDRNRRQQAQLPAARDVILAPEAVGGIATTGKWDGKRERSSPLRAMLSALLDRSPWVTLYFLTFPLSAARGARTGRPLRCPPARRPHRRLREHPGSAKPLEEGGTHGWHRFHRTETARKALCRAGLPLGALPRLPAGDPSQPGKARRGAGGRHSYGGRGRGHGRPRGRGLG